MARRRLPSDLGSEWVTVPRQFRGIKSTSRPTELAYVTPQEIGLLRQADIHRSGLAYKKQAGPQNVLSLDDSGGMYLDPKAYKRAAVAEPGLVHNIHQRQHRKEPEHKGDGRQAKLLQKQ